MFVAEFLLPDRLTTQTTTLGLIKFPGALTEFLLHFFKVVKKGPNSTGGGGGPRRRTS